MSSFLMLNRMTFMVPTAGTGLRFFDCMNILNAKLFIVGRFVEVYNECLSSLNKSRQITNICIRHRIKLYF